MSSEGAPGEGPVDGAQPLRVVVVAAQWHTEICDGLLAGAQRALAESGVRDFKIVRVPGAFELPVAAARIAHGPVDAVIALGVVIRGGTPHFEYVCNSVAHGLTEVAVHSGVPIGFGVLTCDTAEQAIDRAGLAGSSEDKGYEATQAGLATAVTLAPFHKLQPRP